MNIEYTKTDWTDHIVDIETGDVIQEGTRFTASRANNIEDGIYDAYGYLSQYGSELQKLRVQLEMVGRVPVNNGTFFDTLDGQTTKQLTRLSESAVSQTARTIGATVITLDSVPFAIGDYVTVYDDASQESVLISAKTTTTITVSALTKAYKKGAQVRRSNTVIDATTQELTFGKWGTYSISVTEVV